MLVAKVRDKSARETKVTGEVEARMIQLACSNPPEEAARWHMPLLADHLVEIEIIESVSHSTVGLVFRKSALKPWRQECWCIPHERIAAFVAAMEDVLEVS